MRVLSALMCRSGRSPALYFETVPCYGSTHISLSLQLTNHRYFTHWKWSQLLYVFSQLARTLILLEPILCNHLVRSSWSNMSTRKGKHVDFVSTIYALGRLTFWLLRRHTRSGCRWYRCSSRAHIHSLPSYLNNCILQLRFLAYWSSCPCYCCYYFFFDGSSTQFHCYYLCTVLAWVLLYPPLCCLWSWWTSRCTILRSRGSLGKNHTRGSGKCRPWSCTPQTAREKYLPQRNRTCCTYWVSDKFQKTLLLIFVFLAGWHTSTCSS